MKRIASVLILSIVLAQLFAGSVAGQAQQARFTKTALLSDREVAALGAEISGVIAKDTVIELARSHRVQASSGYSRAAEYIAAKAKEYGLEQVQIERFPADGEKTYYTLKSATGWEAQSAELWETEPNKVKIADWEEMRVALADYSQSATTTTTLIDVDMGTSPKDYEGKEVMGRIVLAGGGVAAVHKLACEERGAAGILC